MILILKKRSYRYSALIIFVMFRLYSLQPISKYLTLAKKYMGSIFDRYIEYILYHYDVCSRLSR